MRRTRSFGRRTSRNPLGAVATLIAIAVIAGLAALFLAPPVTHAGRAHGSDGDTLKIGDARIRLLGLDAVELAQTCDRDGEDWTCGREARDYLVSLLAGRQTQCASDRRDQYGRELAHCTVDGGDVGEAVVRAGWAVADLEYALALADARSAKRGIWAARFVDPAEFRRQNEKTPINMWDWLLSLLP
jgi:endonuclease YncB( thermonuclease family)